MIRGPLIREIFGTRGLRRCLTFLHCVTQVAFDTRRGLRRCYADLAVQERVGMIPENERDDNEDVDNDDADNDDEDVEDDWGVNRVSLSV